MFGEDQINENPKENKEEKQKTGFVSYAKNNPLVVMMIVMVFLAFCLGILVVINRMVNPGTTPMAQIELDEVKHAKEKPIIKQYAEEIEKEDHYGKTEDLGATKEEVVSINFDDRFKKRQLAERELKNKGEREKAEREKLILEQSQRQTQVTQKSSSNQGQRNTKPKVKIVYVKDKGSNVAVAKEVPNDEYFEYDGFGSETASEKSEVSEKQETVKKDKSKLVFYKAVIHGESKVVEGSIVKIRLTEDATIDGIKFKKHTMGYGSVTLTKSRVNIVVNSLGEYELNAKVYDAKDLGSGIKYQVPENLLASGEETKDRTVSRTSSSIPTSTDGLANSAINLLKDGGQALNRNMKKKQQDAFLADQYKILIK